MVKNIKTPANKNRELNFRNFIKFANLCYRTKTKHNAKQIIPWHSLQQKIQRNLNKF